MTENYVNAWSVSVAALVYLAIGFRVCKFWMVRAVTWYPATKRCDGLCPEYHPIPTADCKGGFHRGEGVEGPIAVAVLSPLLWPVHIPVLAVWGLGWCIWKPFDVMWRQTKEQAASRKEQPAKSPQITQAVTVAGPAKSYLVACCVCPQYGNRSFEAKRTPDMSEDEFQHFMECAPCRDANTAAIHGVAL